MAQRITEKNAGWKVEVEYTGERFKTFLYAPERFVDERDAVEHFQSRVGSDWVYANLYHRKNGRWGLPIIGHMA